MKSSEAALLGVSLLGASRPSPAAGLQQKTCLSSAPARVTYTVFPAQTQEVHERQ